MRNTSAYRSSKRRKHRGSSLFVAAILLIGGTGIYLYQHSATGQSTAAPISQPQVGTIESDNLPWPSYGEAAIGAEGYGTTAHGEQAAVPTASVAKIMTALAVLKKESLGVGEQGPTITLTQQDVDIYNYYSAHDGSRVAVSVGENISEYQTLEAMLLPSGNNMADTLADWAFGSVETYSNYANSLAASYGLTNSDFTSASGFPPSTVSTAQDLVKLGEVALQNPVIAQIVAEQSADIPVVGSISNTNRLLGTDGIDGIKTGNSNQDEGVFMGSRTVKLPDGRTIQLVSVVMDASSLDEALSDTIPLLETAAQNLGDKTYSASTAPSTSGGTALPDRHRRYINARDQ